jgi:hypothetical protein
MTAAELSHTAQRRLRECTHTKERWTCICEINAQLSRLRNGVHRAANLTLIFSNQKPSRKCPFSKWNRPEPSTQKFTSPQNDSAL